MNDDNAADGKLADIEARVLALETKVASLPDAIQIDERIRANLPPPVDPSRSPSFRDIELPIPNIQTVVASAKTTWAMFEMLHELNMLFWTLLDRRYHMAWITRVITIVLLIMILTSHWWVPFAGSDNTITHLWDKLVDLVLGLLLFMVLSFETRRYKEWRRQR